MSGGEEKKICGIVMPISTIDGCNEGHWSDVLKIVIEAIEDSGFEGNLVSNADDVGIIQKRIIQNLYENPVVVCDVSGKNPNVMFELGMRLAFDKPTIIIKDDKTSYSFDTSPIEHIEYPRDLRFSKIIDFKLKLAEKIKATYEKSTSDASYTTFLKHFGEFKIAKIDKREVSGAEFIIDELKNIKTEIRMLERSGQFGRDYNYREELNSRAVDNFLDYCIGDSSDADIKNVMKFIGILKEVRSIEILGLDKNHRHLRVVLRDLGSRDFIDNRMRKLLDNSKGLCIIGDKKIAME